MKIVREVHTDETLHVNSAQTIQTPRYLEEMQLCAHAWKVSLELVKKGQVRNAQVG